MLAIFCDFLRGYVISARDGDGTVQFLSLDIEKHYFRRTEMKDVEVQLSGILRPDIMIRLI